MKSGVRRAARARAARVSVEELLPSRLEEVLARLQDPDTRWCMGCDRFGGARFLWRGVDGRGVRDDRVLCAGCASELDRPGGSYGRSLRVGVWLVRGGLSLPGGARPVSPSAVAQLRSLLADVTAAGEAPEPELDPINHCANCGESIGDDDTHCDVCAPTPPEAPGVGACPSCYARHPVGGACRPEDVAAAAREDLAHVVERSEPTVPAAAVEALAARVSAIADGLSYGIAWGSGGEHNAKLALRELERDLRALIPAQPAAVRAALEGK